MQLEIFAQIYIWLTGWGLYFLKLLYNNGRNTRIIFVLCCLKQRRLYCIMLRVGFKCSFVHLANLSHACISGVWAALSARGHRLGNDTLWRKNGNQNHSKAKETVSSRWSSSLNITKLSVLSILLNCFSRIPCLKTITTKGDCHKKSNRTER